ncbi:MAG: hypothetical protein WA364_24285 [Candidatus Nitrosopolaris sp.]
MIIPPSLHIREPNKARQEHSRFENLSYAILQELVIFEASSTGKNQEKKVKRCVAVHRLIKHQGIGLRNLSYLMGQEEPKLGLFAYEGYSHCNLCHTEGQLKEGDK